MANVVGRTVLIFVAVLVALAGCAHRVKAHNIKQEQHCMALAMYWEARGEGRPGMTAVGWTILNRVFSPEFPSTPCAVVYQGGERPGCQFSWYCDGRSDRPRDWHSWQHAVMIAAELLTRPPADPTGGALYYHSTSVRSRWHSSRLQTTQIGRHLFYR